MLSPDGRWWWNGTTWAPAASADGRWRWDGERWVPNDLRPAIQRFAREPTALTRRIQAVVTAYLLLGLAVGSVSLVTWAPGYMRAATLIQAQRQEAINPNLPPGYLDFMNSFANTILIVGGVIGLAWVAVLLLGTWRRWRWVYYFEMVGGALAILGLADQLVQVAAGMLPVPGFVTAMSGAGTLLAVALSIWLFVLWRRYRTAWACRRVPIEPAS